MWVGAHTHTHIHTYGMAPGVFACAPLAVIRVRRQRAGVEEQERNSAARSRKWKDIRAPLGFGLLRIKHSDQIQFFW